MPEVVRAARNVLLSMGASILAVAAIGCGGGPGEGTAGDGVENDSIARAASTAPASSGAASCASPSDGCPCTQEGATVDCQGPHIRTGNYTTCAPGERMCSKGAWGACVGKSVVQDADEVTQDYPAACPAGQSVRWGALSLEGLAPGNSQIQVVVQAAASQEDLDGAPTFSLGSFGGATETSWTTADVQPMLDRAGVSGDAWLRVTLTMVQASHAGALPTIAGWQEASTCVTGR